MAKKPTVPQSTIPRHKRLAMGKSVPQGKTPIYPLTSK